MRIFGLVLSMFFIFSGVNASPLCVNMPTVLNKLPTDDTLHSSAYSECVNWFKMHPSSIEYKCPFSKHIYEVRDGILMVQEVDSKMRVLNKSDAQKRSEVYGYYSVLQKYGVEQGINIIKEYYVWKNCTVEDMSKLEEHLRSISQTEILERSKIPPKSKAFSQFLDFI